MDGVVGVERGAPKALEPMELLEEMENAKALPQAS
jgi:hypothetical protein